MAFAVVAAQASGAVSAGARTDYGNISRMSPAELERRATGYRASGQLDSVLLYCNVLAKRYSPELSAAERAICARAMVTGAGIYYERFDYGKAMEMLLRGAQICEREGFHPDLAEAYRLTGNIYSTHSDYERARVFYRKSLRIADSIGDKSLRLKALSNLIGANALDGNLHEARRYYGLLKANRMDSPLYVYDLKINGGLIAAVDHDVPRAAENFRQAAAYASANRLESRYVGAAYSLMADVYRQAGMVDSALHYLHINEATARRLRQDDLLAETLQNLAELYALSGGNAAAQKYRDEYLDISAKIFDRREFISLKNAEFMHELSKSEETIDALNRQKAESALQLTAQRRQLAVVSVGLVLVVGLFVVIYRQKRGLSKAYADLFEKNMASLEAERNYRRRLQEVQEARTEAVPQGAAMDEALRETLQQKISSVLEQTDVICDPEFSANQLARMAGSNSTYVSRVVNEMYGKNFRTVLNECRVRESMRRLADADAYGNYTIKAIAESVGYKSQSNFIAAFKKYTGITPSLYSKMANKRNQ